MKYSKVFFTVTFFSSSFQDDRQLSKETGLCACLPNSTVYVTREKMSILIDSGMEKIGSWNYVLEKKYVKKNILFMKYNIVSLCMQLQCCFLSLWIFFLTYLHYQHLLATGIMKRYMRTSIFFFFAYGAWKAIIWGEKKCCWLFNM